MTEEQQQTGLSQFCCRIMNKENSYFSSNFAMEDEYKVPAKSLLDTVSKEDKESKEGQITVTIEGKIFYT